MIIFPTHKIGTYEDLNDLVSRFHVNVYKSDVEYNPNLKYVPKRVVEQSVW